ncbi:chalcone isomerase family protein [Dechloromonas sp. ZS-1]|uniref:chalcone isomerase family protein n=1 Tax=Dechloromonas sp. ZS-1 TaxID=3138067 RepID=UPI0031FD0ED7
MIASHRIRQAALIAALAAAPGIHAAEVAGVNVEEKIRVGSSELVLNGAGLRSKLFIKLYLGALYTTQKSSTPAVLIDGTGPRRMNLRLLRDIGADTLHGALEEGLQNNNSPAELEAVKAASEQFAALMKGIGKVKEGDTVALDFSVDGVAVSLNGESRGKVAGAAFARALLKVWLGEKPADAALKKALLGQ